MSANAVYIVTITLLIALAILGFWIARQSLGLGGASFFASRQRRRLGLVESTTVDGRRRLLLVRRDNVEHLILTGGPIDVVVEIGIKTPVHSVNSLGEPFARREGQENGDRSDFSEDTLPLILQSDQRN